MTDEQYTRRFNKLKGWIEDISSFDTQGIIIICEMIISRNIKLFSEFDILPAVRWVECKQYDIRAIRKLYELMGNDYHVPFITSGISDYANWLMHTIINGKTIFEGPVVDLSVKDDAGLVNNGPSNSVSNIENEYPSLMFTHQGKSMQATALKPPRAFVDSILEIYANSVINSTPFIDGLDEVISLSSGPLPGVNLKAEITLSDDFKFLSYANDKLVTTTFELENELDWMAPDDNGYLVSVHGATNTLFISVGNKTHAIKYKSVSCNFS